MTFPPATSASLRMLAFFGSLALAACVSAQERLIAPAEAAGRPGVPTLWIAGDSTAANGSEGAIGWGKHLGAFFDPAKLRVENRARGGRSSRTFLTEGLWDRLLDGVKRGDIVLIQFGHNDAGAINDNRRARGSLRGLGEEAEEIDNQLTGKREVVHTYGWYMRKMIADARAKGATPVLLSLTVRNIWNEGRVERGPGRYGEWTRALAKAEHVPFIDLTGLIADRYEQMGEEAVKLLFPSDHTHTGDEGARLNAAMVVSGLKALGDPAVLEALSPSGRTVPVAPQVAIDGGENPSTP